MSGFSRHASRQDLLSVLEQSDFPLDSIRSIDAIIKPGMLPSDTYVVEFDSQAKVRSCLKVFRRKEGFASAHSDRCRGCYDVTAG